ncbi:MAG: hypothetical protein GY811_21325 [Myxococcales bacterium]|nr:hypothetical protein [Myxococcales bacterium]
MTSPIWDYAFGTLTPSSTVRVPERKIYEVPWLVDKRGCVPEQFSGDDIIA